MRHLAISTLKNLNKSDVTAQREHDVEKGLELCEWWLSKPSDHFFCWTFVVVKSPKIACQFSEDLWHALLTYALKINYK